MVAKFGATNTLEKVLMSIDDPIRIIEQGAALGPSFGEVSETLS